MKYKIWFRISVVACIWAFFTSIIYSIIGLVNVLGTENGKLSFQKFVNDSLNTPFIAIMSVGMILSISIITTMMMSLSKVSRKLDNLDEEISLYFKARKRLEDKISKL